MNECPADIEQAVIAQGGLSEAARPSDAALANPALLVALRHGTTKVALQRFNPSHSAPRS